MARPYVSVLVDTYNHERFIEQAVASVLEQDFPAADREIIVVDDGSQDRTPEIVSRFVPQVRLIRKTNGGQASAFNLGIPLCQGEIIAFLDGDDFWVPNKLQVIAEMMAAQPSLGMLGHSFSIVSEGEPSRVISPGGDVSINLRDAYSAEIFRLHRPYLGTSRLILRAAIARKCLPVPEALIFEADEYLFTVASALSGGMVLDKALTCYRAHGANLFLAAGGSVKGQRLKQQVLEALASEFRCVLPALGVPATAARTVVEIVRAEAAQHRLSLEGGWSWEVFQTETALYRMLHAKAPWPSKTFRWLSMIPALLLPPRTFYAFRRWLSSRHWYSRARQTMIPVPPITMPKTHPHAPSNSNSHTET